MSGYPISVGIGVRGGFLVPRFWFLEFCLTLSNKVLYYLFGSSFLITLLPAMVAVYNHGSGCESCVYKQVLRQSNCLNKGLADFLVRGAVDTAHVRD
jgi:hypothetical protein